MSTYFIANNLATATEKAVELSKEIGYAAIILSCGEYYVETDWPFIRTWGELIAEYESGELLT